jgi:chromosome partitioning protein
MSVVAVYNMKGGVGKTTTAVNLAYLSAATGERTLLWDLDPQGASSFAFRVRPHVAGFSRKTLESDHAFAAAIKQTDYDGLDLLPADFGYRKLDRLLARLARPERAVRGILESIGRDYDAVLLDCPPGMSLLTEGVFAAADMVLVPTIPTVLSLRTLAQLIKWADRCDPAPDLAAFFSMADRRKALHRRACEWATRHPEVFLAGHVPYASIVEQMAVRRMPLPVFAPREPAAMAFAAIRAEVQTRLHLAGQRRTPAPNASALLVRAIESFVAGLEFADGSGNAASRVPVVGPDGAERTPAHGEWVARDVDRGPAARSMRKAESPEQGDVQFVHSFDTDCRDLEQRGYVLELCERSGSFLLVAARSEGDDEQTSSDTKTRAQVQIDGRWGTQILSGRRSPLAALERRLGQPLPWLMGHLRAVVGERTLRRIESRQSASRRFSFVAHVSTT